MTTTAPKPPWGDHPLAHKDGIAFFFGYLLHTGSMCPKCGFGTRVTSKRWARCKKCGERCERKPDPELSSRNPVPAPSVAIKAAMVAGAGE